MKAQVSAVRCKDYNDSEVFRRLTECLELIGGIERFVKPGAKVALKPNLLAATEPDQAVTTHPSVVSGLAKIVGQVGGEPFIVDSPGGTVGYNPASLKTLYDATGMMDVAEKTSTRLNYDTSFRIVPHPTGKLVRRFEIIRPILEADVMINLPKFKTHEFTYLTGAVKNLFGVIPGKVKEGYHAKLKNIHNFAEMLIDLLACVKPGLTIVDAIVGMDGDGPLSGRPRELGLLVAGENALSVDILLAKVIGVDPRRIPYIGAAVGRNLCSGDLDVEILGDALESVRVSDFLMPKTLGKDDNVLVTPRIILETCIGCGICEENCPERAVRLVRGKASIDQDRCIRCYCCYEMCPNKAVELIS
jgi:uncharacterized protein (DUF362 family)/NAD-dependent dihydropyrimidine dehydrogenase PreA subunit